MLLDEWGFSRAQAAELVGLTDGQLANWLNRSDLFAERRAGTGRALSFTFRDLLKIAVIKLLTNSGLEAQLAIRAVDRVGSVQAFMLDLANPVPGHLVLSKVDDDGLAPFYDPKADPKLQIRVDLWQVYDDLLPKVLAAMRAEPRKLGADRLEAAIDEAVGLIEKFRSKQSARA